MQNAQSLFTHQGERKYITASERDRFFAEAAKEDFATLTFCLLLSLTGCRVSEALSLSPLHIDRDEQAVRFFTLKRRKQIVWRVVPIPEQMLAMLNVLSEDPNQPVFCFSRSTAWRRVRRLMQTAGITGAQATPKGFRHYFGIHADANGIPEPVLQRWMGHAKLETTSIYRQALGAEERQLANRLCWIG